MNLPEGDGGTVLDSKLMLMESTPVIGTGDWDNYQCKHFKNIDSKGMKNGDIVLVREGQTPLALCEVNGDNFNDPKLASKYLHTNYRHVNILKQYDGAGLFPQPRGTLQRLLKSTGSSWKFIDKLYKEYIQMDAITTGIKLLNMKGQIVLQGPPGTGKTYTAKDLAEQLIFSSISQDKTKQKLRLEGSDQFKFIQFHPSYSYEDFVRGIVAKSNEGEIEYETIEKVFGSFIKAAFSNYQDSQKESTQLNHEQWVRENFEEFLDSIRLSLEDTPKYSLNKTAYIFLVENDAVRYNGDNWPHKNGLRMKSEDIIKLYLLGIKERKNIKKEKSVSSLARDHSTYFKLFLDEFYEFMKDKKQPKPESSSVKEQKYVLIIDEINRANLPSVLGELIYGLEYRNHSVETMYEIEGDKKITIPSNLFIIGTMNTADRSVGHIDYAIRRRFAFIDILPNDTVISNTKAKELFNKVKSLFTIDKIAPEFESKDVQIGHSYFIGNSEEELALKLDYEIKPILREYLKDGILLPETSEEIENLSV